LLCDRQGNPLHVHLTPGQTHESQALTTLLEGVDVVDQDDVPIVYPAKLAGDKGYRADWIDEYLLERGIQPVIPSKANQDHDARAIEFDREAYRQRNIVERLIGWLKESRRVLTRFEKTAKNFLGMIKMAFIHRYLRVLCA
jgi:transposase